MHFLGLEAMLSKVLNGLVHKSAPVVSLICKMHELRACKNMGGKIRINGKNVFQLVLVDPTP